MSLYSQYLKERESGEVLETEDGFASYFINGKECYIRDIYVTPVKRNFRVAADMTDKISIIAKERGCTYLLGTIMTSANGSTNSLKALLAYGFQLQRTDNLGIYLTKEL